MHSVINFGNFNSFYTRKSPLKFYSSGKYFLEISFFVNFRDMVNTG